MTKKRANKKPKERIKRERPEHPRHLFRFLTAAVQGNPKGRLESSQPGLEKKIGKAPSFHDQKNVRREMDKIENTIRKHQTNGFGLETSRCRPR